MIHHPHLHTLSDTIRFHALEHPRDPAVLDGSGRRVDYAQLWDAAQRVAAQLLASGVGQGSRIAYLARESAVYWATLFAASEIGAVLVPVNARLTPPEVAHIIADSGAVVIIRDDDHPLAGTTGIVEWDPEDLWKRPGPDASPALDEIPRPSAVTPLAQLYTSGTTGLPKGVVLAHRSFFAIRDALAGADLDWIDWIPGDVALVGIPGFHIGGLWFATQAFHAGACVVSMPFFDAVRARELLTSEGVTCAILVPAMIRAILDLSPGPQEFARLRKVIYGGAPIADALLREATRVLDCDFAQIYGLTETGNTAICLPPDQHRGPHARLRAAGRPYPGVSVRIVADSGEEAPTWAVGEVWLRTPAAMLDYWNLPAATAETLVDGWIRTGDAGYLDDDGYLFIQDRVKDLILVGGENVYPAEVENALVAHPDVHDAAVVGIPDDAAGEAVLAYVVPVPGRTVSTRQLALFLREHLADFKRPTRYEFVDEIPRNPSGKILRRTLRDAHWVGRERRVG